MKQHTPYQERLNRVPDFVVEYRIDLEEKLKGGKPSQGMRVDFLYDGDDPGKEGIHMIWPEILDQSGEVITDPSPEAFPETGKANMWIVSDERRQYHQKRLKAGTKGMWWRGGRIAYVTVLEINIS